MKTLKIFAIVLMSVLALASCKKQNKVNKPTDPIDVDLHYDMVYMLGAAPGAWDTKSPVAMEKTNDKDVFVAELELIMSAENKLVKFCLSDNKDWWDTEILVPAAANMVEGKPYAFLKEGVNKIELTKQIGGESGSGLRDEFFGLDKGMSGKWRLEVNPVALTVKATRLTKKDDPVIREFEEGMLYMVGEAAPTGWDINQPTPMVKNGDIFTYEGTLKAGEFKIATAWNWDAKFFRPETDLTEISKAGIADEKAVLWAEDDDNDGEKEKADHKWKVVDGGKYKLTLDTKAMTMKAEWLGAAE